MKTRTNSIVRFSALFLLLALFTMMLPVGAIDEPNTDPVSFKEAVHPDIYCDDSTTDGDNQTRQGEGYIVLTSSSWGVAVNYGFFTGTITLTNTLNYSSFSYPVAEQMSGTLSSGYNTVTFVGWVRSYHSKYDMMFQTPYYTEYYINFTATI
jgi:hypothetical protein